MARADGGRGSRGTGLRADRSPAGEDRSFKPALARDPNAPAAYGARREVGDMNRRRPFPVCRLVSPIDPRTPRLPWWGTLILGLVLLFAPNACRGDDPCGGANCYQDFATSDSYGYHCYPDAFFCNNWITSGYDGNVTLDFPYWADEDFWVPLPGDAKFDFDFYVNDVLVESKDCDADCSGKFSHSFYSPRGDTYYQVKLWTRVRTWNPWPLHQQQCSESKTFEGSLRISRPICPTTTTINDMYTYYINDMNARISGTVSDDGCENSMTHRASLRVTVTDPVGNMTVSPDLDVLNGDFSWVYTFPSPKLGHYGTYTAKAEYYKGADYPDHPISNSEDTETFELESKWIVSDYQNVTSSDLVVEVPYGPDPHVAFADLETILLYSTDRGTLTQSVDVSDVVSGAVLGVAATRDFTYQSDYPLLALTTMADNSVVFVDMFGDLVWDYPVSVEAPYGLAYDGQNLWVASWMHDGIARVDLETGHVIHQIYPGIGAVSDLAWDETTQTLLALSLPGLDPSFVYRINPWTGEILEQFYPGHWCFAIAAHQGAIYVLDYGTGAFYQYGAPLGTPGTPAEVRAESGEGTPNAIRLTWVDPDQEPPWSWIQVYRDGMPISFVPPGNQGFTDGDLEEHSYHSYWLTAFREEDGVEGGASETVGTYAGTRPPMAIHVPGDYATIQAAIHAAADEDTILVDPGTYGGGIRFRGRNVRLLSTAGPLTTILDNEGSPWSIVSFDSTEGRGAVLSGFTLRGGELHRAGVIHCGPQASPTIENNVITANTIWYEGGGVLCDGGGSGSPLLQNNTIAFNRMLADTLGQFVGGGIYCRDSAAEISYNIIAFTGNAHGIYSNGAASPVLWCDCVWANELGPYFGCNPGAGDLAVDPLFCDGDGNDLRLCADSPCLEGSGCGRMGALGQGCAACGAPVDHAEHDVGNCVLTVTDRGILGFMDGSQSQGSGFVFPAGGSNLLYLGGFWLGVSPDYIANRDYDADPSKEWVVSEEPDGHVWSDYSGNSDQDIHAAYTDAGADQPRGLLVRQESWAFRDSPSDDFVVIRAFVQNTSGQPLDGLYAGFFLDLDIGDYATNVGGTDPVHHLAYLTGGEGVYTGLRLLMGVRTPDGDPIHDRPANLTLIHNPTFVWPNQYIADEDKYAFLAASDPEHVLSDAPTPDDYGVLASVGPFDLEPGETHEVAFAILGGTGLTDLQANAEAAQTAYLFPMAVPDESEEASHRTLLLPSAPNPFRDATAARFELAGPGWARVEVYDVMGRLVRKLFDGAATAGLHAVTWDGRDEQGRRAGSGLYFVRLDTTELRARRSVLLLR